MQSFATSDEGTALRQHHAMIEDDYLTREADCQGVCLVCGKWSAGVDPGVAAAKCPFCGNRGLHGVDQALLLGFIRIRR
jgi:hypothetical protein